MKAIAGSTLESVIRNAYYAFYFLQSLVGLKKPLLGGIKLTHHCNLRCAACPFWKKSALSLSFSQACAAMRTLYRAGVRIVILEGGEPFIWKDGKTNLSDIVQEARKLFFCVGITTNGTFPIESAADIVWVSIDGLKGTHDRLRSGSFDNAIASIEASTHPRIFAHITINSKNHAEIPELVRFLAPKVAGITVQFHYPYERAGDSLFLAGDARRAVCEKLIALKREGLPLANTYACLKALQNNKWRCRPWMIASVEPDGSITYGCYLKNRAEISCEQCGFSAHTEISLAYGGVLESIRLGNAIFRRTIQKDHV
jgi:MoaA/NifB/PqqE/SkfB family radical SAM enzyme